MVEPKEQLAGRPREAAVVTKWMCEESTTVLLEDKRVLEIFSNYQYLLN